VYSQRLMTLFREAAHAGKAEAETHRGVGGTPGGGPYIVLSFRIAAGVVQEARFQTYCLFRSRVRLERRRGVGRTVGCNACRRHFVGRRRARR
jgi:hypothetical protein